MGGGGGEDLVGLWFEGGGEDLVGLCWATEASPIPALEPAMGFSRTQQTTEGRVNSKQWHWRLILKDIPLFLILPHYLLALTYL